MSTCVKKNVLFVYGKSVSNIEYWLSAASTFSPGSQRHYLVIPSLLTCSFHGQHVHERAVQHSGELQWDSGCTGPNIHIVCVGRCYFWLATASSCGLSWAIGEACQLCTHIAAPGTGEKQHVYTLARLNGGNQSLMSKEVTWSAGNTHIRHILSCLLRILEKQPAYTCLCTEPCAETYWSGRAVSPKQSYRNVFSPSDIL